MHHLSGGLLLAPRYLLCIDELLYQGLVVWHFNIKSAVVVAGNYDACVVITCNLYNVV